MTHRGQAEIAPLVVEIPSSAPFALVALQLTETDPIKRSMYDYVQYGIKLSTAIFGGVVPHFFVKNVQAHVLTF